MRLRYFDQSMTTAVLQHWPARLVPPARERTGAEKLAADGDGFDDIAFGFRYNHANRNLACILRRRKA